MFFIPDFWSPVPARSAVLGRSQKCKQENLLLQDPKHSSFEWPKHRRAISFLIHLTLANVGGNNGNYKLTMFPKEAAKQKGKKKPNQKHLMMAQGRWWMGLLNSLQWLFPFSSQQYENSSSQRQCMWRLKGNVMHRVAEQPQRYITPFYQRCLPSCKRAPRILFSLVCFLMRDALLDPDSPEGGRDPEPLF